jgi:hypothetical protein
MKFRRLGVIELTREPTQTIDEVRMSAKQLFRLVWNIVFIIDSLGEWERGLEEKLDVPRTVSHEVVVPLTTSGNGPDQLKLTGSTSAVTAAAISEQTSEKDQCPVPSRIKTDLLICINGWLGFSPFTSAASS